MREMHGARRVTIFEKHKVNKTIPTHIASQFQSKFSKGVSSQQSFTDAWSIAIDQLREQMTITRFSVHFLRTCITSTLYTLLIVSAMICWSKNLAHMVRNMITITNRNKEQSSGYHTALRIGFLWAVPQSFILEPLSFILSHPNLF